MFVKWCIACGDMMFFASSKWCCSTAFRNDAMFAQCAVRHTSLGEAVIIGEANIICRRQTSFKKRTFVGRQKCVFCWWAIRDSNPGPTGYEPVALTNWANGPYGCKFNSFWIISNKVYIVNVFLKNFTVSFVIVYPKSVLCCEFYEKTAFLLNCYDMFDRI